MIVGHSLLPPRRGTGGMGFRTGRGAARTILAERSKPEDLPGPERPMAR
jgi:hypothetical protein